MRLQKADIRAAGTAYPAVSIISLVILTATEKDFDLPMIYPSAMLSVLTSMSRTLASFYYLLAGEWRNRVRRTRDCVGALLLMSHALAAVAQVSPSEARARLEVLVGSWTVSGKEESYSEICEWYQSRSFVVCNTEEKRSEGVWKSVSILGFSELSGMYTYYNYNSSGGSRSLNGFVRGDELLFTGERPVRGDMVRYQVSVKPTTSGLAFREERSTNGAPWVVAAQVDYIRRK